MVLNARPHMERIVEAKEGDRKIEIGEYPHLFYFTGKYEIFVVDTVLGKISATHGISYSFPDPKGIHVDNTIRLNIVFDSERTVEEAIRSVLDILKFLEVIGGRPQNVSKLAFMLAGTGEENPKILDVYWCMTPRRDVTKNRTNPTRLTC